MAALRMLAEKFGIGSQASSSSKMSQRSASIIFQDEEEARFENYSELRYAVHNILISPRFEFILSIIVAMNIGLMVADADYSAACMMSSEEGVDAVLAECQSNWLDSLNLSFLVFYTVESMTRIWTYRSHFVTDAWALFDLFIVLTGWTDLMVSKLAEMASIPGLQMLRIFRVARLMRALRVLRRVPELHTMIRGFYSAMSAMFWGFMFILLLLMLWSILAVEVVHPLNLELDHENPWCRLAFTSVHDSMLLLFQTLVAGDSWGACTIPLIRIWPATYLIFAGALVTIQLGFTNLILAVIVEKAASCREEDIAKMVASKEKEKRQAEQKFVEICSSIDMDQDDAISLEELTQGYEDNEDLKTCLLLLDIDKEDLTNLFESMDLDKNGTLSYNEITRCIHKAQTQDLRSQIMLLKLKMQEVERGVKEQGVDMLRKDLRDELGQMPHLITAEIKASLQQMLLPGGVIQESNHLRSKVEDSFNVVMGHMTASGISDKANDRKTAEPRAVGPPFQSHAWSRPGQPGSRAGSKATGEAGGWGDPESMWGDPETRALGKDSDARAGNGMGGVLNGYNNHGGDTKSGKFNPGERKQNSAGQRSPSKGRVSEGFRAAMKTPPGES